VPAIYRRALAYINPSLWESFGFQLVEAMACGTPILCSTAHALPEIAAGAAEYFNPNETTDLARLIREVINHPTRLENLKVAGIARRSAFSWSATVRCTEDLYRQIT
jgi:glycosyltransferase involved in cell wall biosynthesis